MIIILLAQSRPRTYPIEMPNMKTKEETREQIQEDMISFIEAYPFISHPEFIKDNICQIVVDNFEDLAWNLLRIYYAKPTQIRWTQRQA